MTAPAVPVAFGRQPKPMPSPWPRLMRMASDPLRWAVFALVVLTLSRIHQRYPAISAMRPGLLATGLVLVYVFLKPGLLAKGSMFRTWPAKVLLGFFVIACLSVPFGISMGNSGQYMLDAYTKTFVFTLIVIATIRNARDLYTYTWGLVVSCGILAVLALFVFELAKYETHARLDDLYTYDANDVGCVLVTGIGFVMLHMKTSRPIGRLIATGLLIIMFGAIANTGSRGALIGVISGGIALLFLSKGASIVGRILTIIVAVAGISFFAPAGYWQQMETILRPTEDYNYTERSGRKQVAERGVSYMMQRPVFGVGIDNFSKAECMLSEDAMDPRYSGPLRCTPAHNSYIQAGAELGIPGMILWLVFMFGSIFAPSRLRKRMPKGWRTGDAEERYLYYATAYIPVGMAGFATSSFFLSFAWMDFTYYLLALLAGLWVATDVKLKQNQLMPRPKAARSKKSAEWRTQRAPERNPPSVPELVTVPSGNDRAGALTSGLPRHASVPPDA